MNTKSAIVALCSVTLLLSGCASTYSARVGEIDQQDFGEANRQTFGAMIVNPEPEYEEPMESSAESAAAAAERVRTRTVVQPEAEDTTSVGSGGGGSGGGG